MTFRCFKIAAIVLASMATAPVDGAFAAGKAFTAILSEDGKTLGYMPCSENEDTECIAYALDCRADSGFGGSLRVTVMGDPENGPDVRAAARTLLDKPFGEAKVRFRVDGSKPLDLMVTAFTVSQNEMDGDWVLELYSYQKDSLLDAITETSAHSATFQIADQTMVLSDNAKAAERLLEFKNTCTD